VVDLLRRRPYRAGELAVALSASAPAMSRHLRVLRTSGLIEEASDAANNDARARVYQLRRAPFTQMRTWLDEVEVFWSDQLASFGAHLERTRGPR
jgi:DNA-binding transcriptional ArsR family regulator